MRCCYFDVWGVVVLFFFRLMFCFSPFFLFLAKRGRIVSLWRWWECYNGVGDDDMSSVLSSSFLSLLLSLMMFFLLLMIMFFYRWRWCR